MSTLILVMGFHVCAEQTFDSLDNVSPSIKLKVTPSVCIVREKGQLCKMRVTAHWESNVPVDVCLYSNEKQLNCWNNQTDVKQVFDIALDKKLIFTLRNKQETLATQYVKVNASQSNKYRRRLRSQWSLF